jgi:hypothetical protein
MTSPGALARERCFNHPPREAVCRCMSCSRSFCRECAIDQEGRLVCAACFVRPASRRETRSRAALWTVLAAVTGFAVAWMCFYAAGRFLLLYSDGWRLQ